MSTDRNEQNDLSQFYLQFLESKKKKNTNQRLNIFPLLFFK